MENEKRIEVLERKVDILIDNLLGILEVLNTLSINNEDDHYKSLVYEHKFESIHGDIHYNEVDFCNEFNDNIDQLKAMQGGM